MTRVAAIDCGTNSIRLLVADLPVSGAGAPLVDVVMGRAQGAMTAKAALQLLGVLDNRNVRLPLVPASEALVTVLREVMTATGLLP